MTGDALRGPFGFAQGRLLKRRSSTVLLAPVILGRDQKSHEIEDRGIPLLAKDARNGAPGVASLESKNSETSQVIFSS
jgi:hypothetical protein